MKKNKNTHPGWFRTLLLIPFVQYLFTLLVSMGTGLALLLFLDGYTTASISNWPKDIKQLTTDKEIQRTLNSFSILDPVGMTREQAILTWGEPYKINKRSGSWGIHEQWVMYDRIRNRVYLYFMNDRLISWQIRR